MTTLVRDPNVESSCRDLFVDIGFSQRQKHGQGICGDAFRFTRNDDGRYIAVLSDGLGSGVKANILATMTATMAMKFAANNRDIKQSAGIMMSALPICQVRKISYATFSIVDACLNGVTRLIEMGNPPAILLRGGRAIRTNPREITAANWRDRKIAVSEFELRPQDRLMLMSDGVTQAGMGTTEYPLGWRTDNCRDFIEEQLAKESGLGAQELCQRVVRMACRKEPGFQNKDDVSCACIYIRTAQRMMLATGPAFHKEHDAEFAQRIAGFTGCRVIAGGTTARIVSRELDRKLELALRTITDELPPTAIMDGFDLVTEGILTLTKAAEYLETGSENQADPAGKLVALMRQHDQIDFVVGTRVNEAHQDPTLPEGLELRRNIVKRISDLLRDKYFKEVSIRYV